jgi:uncharacterized protein (TIGR00369 family)
LTVRLVNPADDVEINGPEWIRPEWIGPEWIGPEWIGQRGKKMPEQSLPDSFDVAAAAALLADVTAPWVRDLGLEVVSIGRTQSVFFLPFSDRLTRDAGMICGQAIVAAGDTAMIAAVTAAVGEYAPITTVDISSRFLRPLGSDGGDVTVDILKAGRRLVVGRISIADRASGKLAAELTSTYARL